MTFKNETILREKPEWEHSTGHELPKKTYYPNYEAAVLRTLLILRREKQNLQSYLNSFTELARELPADVANDTTLSVALTEGCGEPYASDIRRLDLNTFTEQFEYLQRQANILHSLPEFAIAAAREADPIAVALTAREPSTLTDTEITAINKAMKANMVCYYCRKKGHIKRDCRKKAADAKLAR
ncbi:hypothetical protein FT663_02251 [Candidozyma haemuli var. vulneris]|uniref:CCHC-type domain-containing protein n=1 Tax=Candidozyma haemuli TaxID=45357 RepID=A0A2V1ASQ7_9ASCO|nr:hypothetical protein CXQ85_000206 [[Candida] haemuloni]KAF3992598.1 hypothetical protein FT663_02251 [[Candida] haemuloni var. vulneris]KAF3992650.1 hypothetical protein FT662_01031 [[Candida] haemuloni var. vulneris]PVH21237.1 hypothetical protein CXQ85_000206 [[Candida] haemuloni]